MLPSELVDLTLDLAPWGAVNGLLRTCRRAAARDVDPNKWVTMIKSEHRFRRELPNGIWHGIASCLHNQIIMSCSFHLGDPTYWTCVRGLFKVQGRIGSCSVMVSHGDNVERFEIWLSRAVCVQAIPMTEQGRPVDFVNIFLCASGNRMKIGGPIEADISSHPTGWFPRVADIIAADIIPVARGLVFANCPRDDGVNNPAPLSCNCWLCDPFDTFDIGLFSDDGPFAGVLTALRPQKLPLKVLRLIDAPALRLTCRGLMPPPTLPRDVVYMIMRHWNGRALGLTCRELAARSRVGDYAKISSAGNGMFVRRLPNGRHHGEVVIYLNTTKCDLHVLYNAGRLVHVDTMKTGTSELITRRMLIDGWECQWTDGVVDLKRDNMSTATRISWKIPLLALEKSVRKFVRRAGRGNCKVIFALSRLPSITLPQVM